MERKGEQAHPRTVRLASTPVRAVTPQTLLDGRGIMGIWTQGEHVLNVEQLARGPGLLAQLAIDDVELELIQPKKRVVAHTPSTIAFECERARCGRRRRRQANVQPRRG